MKLRGSSSYSYQNMPDIFISSFKRTKSNTDTYKKWWRDQ